MGGVSFIQYDIDEEVQVFVNFDLNDWFSSG